MHVNSSFLFLLGALITLSFMPSAHSQNDATKGLYVCTSNDGMTNIVTKAQANSNCRPYEKGILSQNTATTPSNTQHTAPNRLTLTPAPQSPSTPLFNTINPPPIPPTTQPPSQSNSQASQEQETIQSSPPPSQSNASNIYLCPTPNGGSSIIEGNNPPSPHCISFGKKGGESASQTAQSTAPTKQSNTKSQPTQPTTQAQITTLDSPPKDIYKCYDNTGRPSFVSEDARQHYKHCTFFSRSFSDVKAQLKHSSENPPTLTELAAQGVRTPPNSSGAALNCSGAGSIVFNGESKTYNCATRSFDYARGSTGGSVRLGEQQAIIAAHNLDYFSGGGSCGGTIIAENGRTLHLEPTKECPAAFKIEAQRIAAAVERSLSINVSGAFKQRQQTLAAQINEISARVGIDPYLVHAVISAESAYKSNALSHAGAQGLMQLMPATAKRFGVSDPYHTGENIRGGATYLKWLLNEFNGNLELAIAGYNAGEGNVRKYGYKIPPFIETRAYVPKVLQYYRRYHDNPKEIGL